MLRLNEKNIIPLKTLSRNNCVISCYTNRKIRTAVFIASITEEQEHKIDNGENIVIDDVNLHVKLEIKQIYCYGEVDFVSDEEDLIAISRLDWTCLNLSPLKIVGSYNYKNHSCESYDNKIKYYDSTDPEAVIPYLHAMIRKPKRICIFKTNFIV